MKYFFILLTAALCSLYMKAQTAEDSVKAVINKMFTGMKNADVDLLKSSFADSMILQTIARDKEGKVFVRNETAAGFIDFISKEIPGNADEQIIFDVVKVDGPLAIAWTPYNFYYKGQFSHCGVNSFQLVRFNGQWKIQYIIDTRKRQGCSQ
ncbi:MAG: nuclear transport factor 2 family protein [Sphingobacteriales bacterium]|nr:nuclear transport factor 2 family protein [Sphingobacteriales bacterium]